MVQTFEELRTDTPTPKLTVTPTRVTVKYPHSLPDADAAVCNAIATRVAVAHTAHNFVRTLRGFFEKVDGHWAVRPRTDGARRVPPFGTVTLTSEIKVEVDISEWTKNTAHVNVKDTLPKAYFMRILKEAGIAVARLSPREYVFGDVTVRRINLDLPKQSIGLRWELQDTLGRTLQYTSLTDAARAVIGHKEQI